MTSKIGVAIRECVYCGSTNKRLVKDHFIPRSALGGSDQCVLACNECNVKKSAKHPRLWYRQQPFYSESRWHDILDFLGMSEQDIDSAMLTAARSRLKVGLRCRLQGLLDVQGMTRFDLAQATGLSSLAIRLLCENKARRYDSSTLALLCGFFGVGMGEFFELVPTEIEHDRTVLPKPDQQDRRANC